MMLILTKKHKQTSITSKVAISMHQHSDILESVEEDKSQNLTSDNDSLEFEYCDKESPEIKYQCEQLQQEIEELQSKLTEAENKLRRSRFRFENIKYDDEMVRFYTGIPDQATLMVFCEEILEDDAKVMRQWEGKKSKDGSADNKTGHHHKQGRLLRF